MTFRQPEEGFSFLLFMINWSLLFTYSSPVVHMLPEQPWNNVSPLGLSKNKHWGPVYRNSCVIIHMVNSLNTNQISGESQADTCFAYRLPWILNVVWIYCMENADFYTSEVDSCVRSYLLVLIVQVSKILWLPDTSGQISAPIGWAELPVVLCVLFFNSTRNICLIMLCDNE